MTPPTRDEIRDFMAEAMAGEGVDEEPDKVVVEGVAHALRALDLSVLAMPDDMRITVVGLATLAFTYGQNATAMRLAAWTASRESAYDAKTTCEWLAAQMTAMRKGERPFPPMPEGALPAGEEVTRG